MGARDTGTSLRKAKELATAGMRSPFPQPPHLSWSTSPQGLPLPH